MDIVRQAFQYFVNYNQITLSNLVLINKRLVIFKQLVGISSDSIKLITEFGSPGMIGSLGLIKQIASVVKEITEALEDPITNKNIENLNISLETMRDSRDRIRNVSRQLKDTHLIEEAKIMSSSIRSKTDQESIQDLKELIVILKETMSAVRRLTKEFTSWQRVA